MPIENSKIFKLQKYMFILVVLFLVILSSVGCNTTASKEIAIKAPKPTSVVKILGLGQYMDNSLIKDFESISGVKAVFDTFSTTEEMYENLKNTDCKYDMAIVSGNMVESLTHQGLLSELNMGQFANAKLIDKRFLSLSYDPKNNFSIPFTWGTLGVLHNASLSNRNLDSWSLFWEKGLEGKITILDSERANIAVGLKLLKYSLNSTNRNELLKAQALLLQQRPMLPQYTSTDIGGRLVNGELSASMVWSDDAVRLTGRYPAKLKYVIPKEGSSWFVDNFVLIKGGINSAEAIKFIDYMHSPEAAMKTVRRTHTLSVNTSVIQGLSAENEVYKGLTYPVNGKLKNCEMFKDLDDATHTIYQEIWKKLQQ